MVSILDDLTRVSATRGDFTVTSKTIEPLLDAAAASLVLKKAAELGLNRPGVSNVSGPYPVDADGKTDDELLMGKRGAVSEYRRDFVVLAGL
jgi:hypothetical protein